MQDNVFFGISKQNTPDNFSVVTKITFWLNNDTVTI